MLQMKIKYLLLILLAILLVSCSKKTKTEEEYLATAKSLYDSAMAKKDNALFNEAINEYKEFIQNYPKSEKVLSAYTQIGFINSENLNNYPEAIKVYTEIADKFPTTPEAKKSLFLVAFTYDDYLKDKDNAIKAYQKFLEKYPTDTDPNEKLSESAKVMLQTLQSGSSIEDMIKNNESQTKDKKDDSKTGGDKKEGEKTKVKSTDKDEAPKNVKAPANQ